MKTLSLLIVLLFSSISLGQYNGPVREVKNYHGGYNYYIGTKLVLQTKQGIGREHVYQGTRKIGEVRSFGNTRSFYFSNPGFKFEKGKIIVK